MTKKMAETFELEIVTPERLVVKDVAQEIQIPGKKGYMGILAGHAPLISELAVGEITYRDGAAGLHRLACAWGFAEVLPNKVTILAETAERADQIDTGRAKIARDRAEQRLKNPEPGINYDRALNALKRAEVRLDVAAGK
jgi:F-type H+-transporting ATPase subunit epsilon